MAARKSKTKKRVKVEWMFISSGKCTTISVEKCTTLS